MLKVLFMGTPDFAAVSLQKMLDYGYDVCGIFTQPDKPVGRGNKITMSPVKALAIKAGIPIYQPEKIKNIETYNLIEEINPDIIVVVAYGKIISDEIIAFPKYGIINIHGSILPKYRGAAPIQWAVLNGEKITGVTSMYISHDMDAGDIIFTDKTEIRPYESSGELFNRLSEMGGNLLIKTLLAIEKGTAPRTPQNHAEASYTKQLDKSYSPIDFNKKSNEIINQIYGLIPWPVATMQIGENIYKVFSASYTNGISIHSPGTIVNIDDNGIEICCGDNKSILITEIQAPGKKRMYVKDYIRGNKL